MVDHMGININHEEHLPYTNQSQMTDYKLAVRILVLQNLFDILSHFCRNF